MNASPNIAVMPLSWIGIVRLGLVQMCLGSIVVLMTSTLNRVMVVELHLPSVLPASLIALHYAVQILRPRWGYGSDVGGRLTPWIVGGMAVLALGGLAAAVSTTIIVDHRGGGITLAATGFLAIGMGVGACGTSLLVLLAKRTAPERRAPAATIVWIMMIAGFAVTAGSAGQFLDPFTPLRLVEVVGVVALLAIALTTMAVAGIEGAVGQNAVPVEAAQAPREAPVPFLRAAREVLSEPTARRFMVFIFVSMLAYSAQELILEPFSGLVYAMTPGQSTKLSGLQHSGVLLGMLLVALSGLVMRRSDARVLRSWATGGCLASAAVLVAIAVGALWFPAWPFKAMVFALGVANGAFAIAAVGSMMALVGEGHRSREGVRMGLWGAAQGVAFGLGGFSGALAVDVTRALMPSPAMAYSTVFLIEALVFVISAWLAATIGRVQPSHIETTRSDTIRTETSIELAFAAPSGRIS